MNDVGYLLYFICTYIVTVRAGWIFYRNGRVYILQLTGGNETLTDAINKLLLTGYYLLNLGYAAVAIRSWTDILTLEQLIVSVVSLMAKIMLLLAIIHFFNLLSIYLVSRYRNRLYKNKN